MEETNHISQSLVEQEREIETYFTKKYCRLVVCNVCILLASLFCIIYIYCSQT